MIYFDQSSFRKGHLFHKCRRGLSLSCSITTRKNEVLIAKDGQLEIMRDNFKMKLILWVVE